MRIEDGYMTWALMPLFLTGVLCNAWKVEYQRQRICAVKGSSVAVLCSFYHPDNQRVKRVAWGHVKPRHFKGRIISDSNSRKVTSRFQYIGDKQHNCSLEIQQVKLSDAGIYTVRFNTKDGSWADNVSPALKVVDLNVLVTTPSGNRTTNEGDSVNLTCVNGCDGGNRSSAFTWFKNGEPINEGHALYLSNVSSANSGNYTCSLKTHAGTTSRGEHIDVEYGPKNTSVSVRPSMEVDAGSSITLMCSSHANPPVENYTWLKIDDDDDVVAVGQESVFVSGDGGQYLCSVTNKHGSQNSSVVTLRIKAYWATFTRDVLILSAVAVIVLIGAAVIAVRRLNKKKTWAPKTDCEDDTQNADSVSWLICDNNQSQEGHRCGGGTTEVIYASVHFNNMESNMERQMDSHKDEDVIYSTVCRNQLLNPSYIEPL